MKATSASKKAISWHENLAGEQPSLADALWTGWERLLCTWDVGQIISVKKGGPSSPLESAS